MSRRPLNLLLATTALWCSAAALAGDLDPPAGPVTPTMKTLSEVEPRIPIGPDTTPGDSQSTFIISQPGSYYFTGRVTGESGKRGILINAHGVKLDLNGFTLQGVSGSLDGIFMTGFRDGVVIRNGHVSNWGESGIQTRIDTGRIEDITAISNGEWGIDNGSAGAFTTHILRCDARANGNTLPGGGIRASQSAVISHCVAFANFGDGVAADTESRVMHTTSADNTVHGIVVNTGSMVSDCVATGNGADGVRLVNDSYIARNLCKANGNGSDGAGIHAIGNDNRIEDNVCLDADRGIDVDAAGNFIARNTCSGNTVNWEIFNGNVCLVILATTSAPINGNSGGVSPGSTDPNANFTY